jgi:hypothetical protein
VASSGSTGSGDEKSGIQGYLEKILKLYNDAYLDVVKAFNDFKDNNFKPPNYEVNITDAMILKECFDISPETKSPCLLVNLDIKNNQNDSITFELTGRTIVTKDGKQFDKYGGIYNTRQLNAQCDTEIFFKLFPNANKKVGVCFPIVSKVDAPILYLGIKANGKQKEYHFDMDSFISK